MLRMTSVLVLEKRSNPTGLGNDFKSMASSFAVDESAETQVSNKAQL